jgi:predicted TIM-barrel fold metal-dependent hydrolase
MIDAAAHCASPPVEQLLPYLEPHWQAYLRETFLAGASSGTGRLHTTAGASFTHPGWAEGLSLPPQELTLEVLRERVLDQAERAVIHCYSGVEAFTHPYFGPAMATAVNQWLADEWLDRDDRLLGTAVIAPQHADAAVAEIHRVGQDPRFVQVALPARSVEPYGAQRYWPIWEAAAEHRLAVAITYGGASLTSPTPVNWPGSFFELYTLAPLQFGTHLASIVFSGVLRRFDDLRVVMVESGWTWLPPLLWRMDWEWKGSRREVPWVDERPSEFVRRHVRFTTQPCDRPDDLGRLREIIEQIGSDDMLLYASDHPRAPEFALDDPALGLDAALVERIRRTNAWECFDLEQRLGATAGDAA